MNVVSELITAAVAYGLQTRQLFGADLLDLVSKVGINMSSVGAIGFPIGRFDFNVRLVLNYVFAAFLVSIASRFIPIPPPMLAIGARKPARVQ